MYLLEFMYLAFTCIPGESYYRQLRSSLCLCNIFQALINSLLCWFWSKGNYWKSWSYNLCKLYCFILTKLKGRLWFVFTVRLQISMEKCILVPGLKSAQCTSMTSQNRLPLLMIQKLQRDTILNRSTLSRYSRSTARKGLLSTGLQLPEVHSCLKPFLDLAVPVAAWCTVITLDIFQTSVASRRWRRWFTETGQPVTVSCQIHSCLYYY